MRFELIRLMVTKGSRDVKEGEYWAIKDNEEIEDYKNGYCCDLEHVMHVIDNAVNEVI